MSGDGSVVEGRGGRDGEVVKGLKEGLEAGGGDLGGPGRVRRGERRTEDSEESREVCSRCILTGSSPR
eukprot:CAMPEP_0196583150 /NCGR_PEP_ID=MMETSP1081-20130531/42274_1 /TAXON_ID=36882 /ORGANISM="Pyramimonas amylifera, Strain CCMP720" /LENGTH=67 /DNA_ID=CAMNT_0041903945 /DNA_START=44 /DNA_END=244 /DNA_ORIENTATION=+